MRSIFIFVQICGILATFWDCSDNPMCGQVCGDEWCNQGAGIAEASECSFDYTLEQYGAACWVNDLYENVEFEDSVLRIWDCCSEPCTQYVGDEWCCQQHTWAILAEADEGTNFVTYCNYSMNYTSPGNIIMLKCVEDDIVCTNALNNTSSGDDWENMDTYQYAYVWDCSLDEEVIEKCGSTFANQNANGYFMEGICSISILTTNEFHICECSNVVWAEMDLCDTINQTKVYTRLRDTVCIDEDGEPIYLDNGDIVECISGKCSSFAHDWICECENGHIGKYCHPISQNCTTADNSVLLSCKNGNCLYDEDAPYCECTEDGFGKLCEAKNVCLDEFGWATGDICANECNNGTCVCENENNCFEGEVCSEGGCLKEDEKSTDKFVYIIIAAAAIAGSVTLLIFGVYLVRKAMKKTSSRVTPSILSDKVC